MEEDAISGSAPHPAIDNIAPEGPVEVAPATGQGLADAARYSFDKIIGKGSSATVWKAFDKKEGTTVAVKEFECWDGSRSQFHREVEILKTLNAADEQGQYTVRLLDEFRNSNGRPCIVMNTYVCTPLAQYLAGKCLKQLIHEHKSAKDAPGLPISMIRKISQDVLKVLKFLATEMSMLHGDIKPENVMLVYDNAGELSGAHVIDFGLAFRSRGDLKRNMYIQSRWYRSPEVLLGIPATPQVDLWSFGCMLVEMFTGVCPFRGNDSYDQMLLIMDAMGMPSQHLRSNCEDATLQKLDEMSLIVTRRWQEHFDLAPGQTRSHKEIQQRLKRKLLSYRPRRNDTDEQREQLVDLVVRLLREDPYERLSAADALTHPLFTPVRSAAPARYETSGAVSYVAKSTRTDDKKQLKLAMSDVGVRRSSGMHRSRGGFTTLSAPQPIEKAGGDASHSDTLEPGTGTRRTRFPSKMETLLCKWGVSASKELKIPLLRAPARGSPQAAEPGDEAAGEGPSGGVGVGNMRAHLSAHVDSKPRMLPALAACVFPFPVRCQTLKYQARSRLDARAGAPARRTL